MLYIRGCCPENVNTHPPPTHCERHELQEFTDVTQAWSIRVTGYPMLELVI